MVQGQKLVSWFGSVVGLCLAACDMDQGERHETEQCFAVERRPHPRLSPYRVTCCEIPISVEGAAPAPVGIRVKTTPGCCGCLAAATQGTM